MQVINDKLLSSLKTDCYKAFDNKNYMKSILYSALYSFKEIKNSKIFYSFLIFALILISGSYFVSQTSFINQDRIMVDFSIFAIVLFNIFIGIFIGSSIVYDDIEKKSIFLSITKPFKRSYYLIGRISGLALAIILSTFIMNVIFYLVLLIMHQYISNLILPQAVLVQGFFIVIESIFISVIALFFSLITSKTLASVLTMLVFFIGNVSSKMNDLIEPIKRIVNGKIVIVHHANHVLVYIVHFIYVTLPNFAIFNISTNVSYKIKIPATTVLYSFIYGVSYSILIFIISILIFNKKDIS